MCRTLFLPPSYSSLGSSGSSGLEAGVHSCLAQLRRGRALRKTVGRAKHVRASMLMTHRESGWGKPRAPRIGHQHTRHGWVYDAKYHFCKVDRHSVTATLHTGRNKDQSFHKTRVLVQQKARNHRAQAQHNQTLSTSWGKKPTRLK